MKDRNRCAKWIVVCLTGAGLCLTGTGCAKNTGCAANTAECLGDRLVHICPADGTSWASFTCESWQTCKAGACQPLDGIPATCTAGAGTCLSDKVVSICVASGMAPTVIACEEGETCKDGVCAPPACTPGATECVGTALMRTCASDGVSWVPSPCALDEVCDPTAKVCMRNPAVACSFGDNDCFKGIPFVCKKDYSGFDTTPCPANTHCVGAGRCQGNGPNGCVIGTTCSAGMLITCNDGKTASYTECAIQHVCAVDPTTRVASCKLLVCIPGEVACGNKTDLTADPSLYLSTCKSDGSGWLVARCETGSLCNTDFDVPECSFKCTPTRQTCSDNSVVTCSALGIWDLSSVSNCGGGQVCYVLDSLTAACGDSDCSDGSSGVCVDATHFRPCRAGKLTDAVECKGGCMFGYCSQGCLDGETLCVTAGKGSAVNGVVTCTGGQWGDVSSMTTCTVLQDPKDSQTCVQLSDLENAHKAVCGDAICRPSNRRQQCDDLGEIQYCRDGKLQPPVACPTGFTCLPVTADCEPGDACQAGETLCYGANTFTTCDSGQWSKRYTNCPPATEGLQSCINTTDTTGLSKAVCVDLSVGCTPGDRRCTADLGSLQTCGADRQWSSAACTFGLCDPMQLLCAAQCKPSQVLCGGAPISVYGQTGYTKSATCSANGTVTNWTTAPTCPAGTYCRFDIDGNALGCVECVGSVKTPTSFVDTKCSTDGTSVIFCADGNTWGGDKIQQSCDAPSCVPPGFLGPNTPALCD